LAFALTKHFGVKYIQKNRQKGGHMQKEKLPAIQEQTKIPLARRDFCKSVVKRSLAFLAFTAGAATLTYRKPAIRSFFGGKSAYAQVTGAGKFTLRGGIAVPAAPQKRR
jgi:hypothetical protein